MTLKGQDEVEKHKIWSFFVALLVSAVVWVQTKAYQLSAKNINESPPIKISTSVGFDNSIFNFIRSSVKLGDLTSWSQGYRADVFYCIEKICRVFIDMSNLPYNFFAAESCKWDEEDDLLLLANSL